MENWQVHGEFKALHASAEVRAVTDSVKDYAIFLLDPQGIVVTWNVGAERLKGYTAPEIIGQSIERFYTEQDRTAGLPRALLAQAAREGRVEYEGWRVRKNGSRFWADVIINRIQGKTGELIGFTKVTRDLTERRRAAEELIERASQQSAVSSLGLYALQTADLGLVRNRALEVTRETLRVDDVRILFAGEPAPPGSMTAVIHAADAQGELGTLAVLSGRELSANDTSFLQAVANVVAAAFVRARTEEQLRAAERQAIEERGRTSQAQQALQERDDFISVAAHELRTPLTALQLKLQGLARAGGIERKTDRLGGAVRQTHRLTQLVDRLLDVSRIAQGRVEMRPETFDIAALVRQVAEDFREPAVQVHSPLRLQLPERLLGTWDRLRTEQVLVNLLSNAVKYGAGKPIVVTLDALSDTVRLAVADQGIGIAPEDVSRIFGRFQRAAPIRNYGGMGLGLFINRHIVEAHGGTISIVSNVGEGATFVVELPFRPTVAAGEQEHLKARA